MNHLFKFQYNELLRCRHDAASVLQASAAHSMNSGQFHFSVKRCPGKLRCCGSPWSRLWLRESLVFGFLFLLSSFDFYKFILGSKEQSGHEEEKRRQRQDAYQ